MNKKVVLLALVLVTTAFLLGGCGTNQQIGVLDANKVMTSSPKVKDMQDQLNAKGKELSDKLASEQPTLSEDEFKKHQETAYNEFLKTKQDMEGQIDASMKQALEQVAKDKKLDVIIYKGSIAQGGTDVTDDVIAKIQ